MKNKKKTNKETLELDDFRQMMTDELCSEMSSLTEARKQLVTEALNEGETWKATLTEFSQSIQQLTNSTLAKIMEENPPLPQLRYLLRMKPDWGEPFICCSETEFGIACQLTVHMIGMGWVYAKEHDHHEPQEWLCETYQWINQEAVCGWHIVDRSSITKTYEELERAFNSGGFGDSGDG